MYQTAAPQPFNRFSFNQFSRTCLKRLQKTFAATLVDPLITVKRKEAVSISLKNNITTETTASITTASLTEQATLTGAQAFLPYQERLLSLLAQLIDGLNHSTQTIAEIPPKELVKLCQRLQQSVRDPGNIHHSQRQHLFNTWQQAMAAVTTSLSSPLQQTIQQCRQLWQLHLTDPSDTNAESASSYHKLNRLLMGIG